MMCWYNSDTNDVGGINTGFISPLGDEPKMDNAWAAKNLSWIG